MLVAKNKYAPWEFYICRNSGTKLLPFSYWTTPFFEERTYSTALNDMVPIIRDGNTIEVFKRLNLNRERWDSIIIVAVVRK